MTDDSNTGRNVAIIAVVLVVGFVFLALVAIVGLAVVGGFVLDVGSEASSPDAPFTVNEEADAIVVAYEERSGSFDSATLSVVVNGASRGSWQELESTHDDERTIRVSFQSGDHLELRWYDDGESTIATYGD